MTMRVAGAAAAIFAGSGDAAAGQLNVEQADVGLVGAHGANGRRGVRDLVDDVDAGALERAPYAEARHQLRFRQHGARPRHPLPCSHTAIPPWPSSSHRKRARHSYTKA